MFAARASGLSPNSAVWTQLLILTVDVARLQPWQHIPLEGLGEKRLLERRAAAFLRDSASLVRRFLQLGSGLQRWPLG